MGTAGGMMQIGKSKAKVYIEKKTGVTFADVEGIDDAEEELVEVVEFLKNLQKISKIGRSYSEGRLAGRPPGTGKTLLARVVAGEAGVPVFSISGSDFVEMFVGVGRPVLGIFSARPRSMLPASSLSMSWMPWVKREA